jgi:hypothetical protein
MRGHARLGDSFNLAHVTVFVAITGIYPLFAQRVVVLWFRPVGRLSEQNPTLGTTSRLSVMQREHTSAFLVSHDL